MGRRWVVLLIMFLIGVTAEAGVIFTGDFESGDFKGWGLEIAGPEHGKIVTEPVRAGKYAARLMVTRTQKDVANSKRAEITLKKSGGPNTANTDCWFGWSLYLPADWTRDPESTEIVTQWHELPDWDLGEEWRSPPVSLQVKGDRYHWSLIWDTRPVTPKNNAEGHASLEAGKVDFGQWTDWVLHIKWSYGQDGLIEAWKNGEKVTDYKGPNGYNDKQETYFKVGIYKWEWKSLTNRSVAQMHVLGVDEVRFGDRNSSYEEVAPKPVTPRK